MDLGRLARTVWTGCVTVLIVGPVAALAISAMVDRGPDGSPRLTAFPLALTISDPTAREAIRNSLILAGGVSAGSLLLGTILARIGSRGRFPGLRPLRGLAAIPGGIPPVIAALGLLCWIAGRPVFDVPAVPWIALAWAELAWGVPRVMRAASRALERVDPSWDDAARLAGASRRRAFREGTWPLIRPRAARAAAEVFVMTLMEPGAPLILGVRRTLAFRVVQAVADGDSLAIASALGLLGAGLAVVGRWLIRAWGGPSWPLPDRVARRLPRSSGFSSVGAALIFLGWSAIGLVPVAGLVFRVGVGPGPLGESVRAALLDPDSIPVLLHGVILGLAVAAAGLLLAWTVARDGEPSRLRGLSGWPRAIPPLGIGLGVLAVPGLLESLASGRSGSLAASGLRELARFLDPYASPWPPLLWAVTIVMVPDLARSAAAGRSGPRREEIEAARTLGASAWTAWFTVSRPRWWALARGVGMTVGASAALHSAASLPLTPTDAARPIGPGLIALAARPEGLRVAPVVALLALGLPSLASLGRRPSPESSR